MTEKKILKYKFFADSITFEQWQEKNDILVSLIYPVANRLNMETGENGKTSSLEAGLGYGIMVVYFVKYDD